MYLRIVQILSVGSLVACVAAADADVVRLKNGGEVRGRVRRDAEGASVVEVETLSGGVVRIDAELVEFHVFRPLKVEEYETRARRIEDTVESHWSLAEWCRAEQLKPQRAEQLERVVQLDPDHEEAHRGLGHIRHDGEWMTRDAAMAAQGYIKHDGKYVTQQQLDLMLKSDAERAEEQAWYPKVRLWFNWASGRNEDRQREGVARLTEVDDPAAAPALASVMADHADPLVRQFFVARLSRMPGLKPVPFLVRRSLFDDDYEVRHSARAALQPDQHEEAVKYYVPELRHKENPVVLRAAEALGLIGDDRVVPDLIEALVTRHTFKIQVPANSAVSVGIAGNGQVGMAGNGAVLPPEVEIALRTGQLPYGAVVIESNPVPRRMKTVLVKSELQNAEVRTALEKITRESFGFNEREWRLWWASYTSGLMGAAQPD